MASRLSPDDVGLQLLENTAALSDTATGGIRGDRLAELSQLDRQKRRTPIRDPSSTSLSGTPSRSTATAASRAATTPDVDSGVTFGPTVERRAGPR